MRAAPPPLLQESSGVGQEFLQVLWRLQIGQECSASLLHPHTTELHKEGWNQFRETGPLGVRGADGVLKPTNGRHEAGRAPLFTRKRLL